MRGTKSHAVVLLSGGVDSSTALALALRDGHVCHALTFQYGQRHSAEVEAAKRIARSMGVSDHRIVAAHLGELGGSALTDRALPVPKGRTREQIGSDIPVTYVPARNTIFLSYALSLAEVTASDYIYIGVSAVDSSGYPDCRPEYIEAFRRLAALATRRAVEERAPQIVTPFIKKSKADIIRAGVGMGVDYSLTVSCYDPDAQGLACGACDSCLLRRRAFADAGVPDPTVYQPGVKFPGR